MKLKAKKEKKKNPQNKAERSICNMQQGLCHSICIIYKAISDNQGVRRKPSVSGVNDDFTLHFISLSNPRFPRIYTRGHWKPPADGSGKVGKS